MTTGKPAPDAQSASPDWRVMLLCGALFGVVLLICCGPRFLAAWLRDSARGWLPMSLRVRIAMRPARTRRAYRRRALAARRQSVDYGDMSNSEYVAWRRIAGGLAHNEVAKAGRNR